MGSIEQGEQLYGTMKHPIDIPTPSYDPYSLAYFKAPEYLFKTTVDRTYPIDDFRHEVLDGEYSLQRSQDYLRDYGYTAVKHRTALLSPPYGSPKDFQNVKLINDIYYPELEDLIKKVTGCSRVFVENSIIRGPSEKDVTKMVDEDWKKEEESSSTKLHKSEPVPIVRIPHWDWSAVGVRSGIRQMSKEIREHAESLGIPQAEDKVCTSFSATDPESDAVLQEQYNGPRYAIYSIWRPLKKVTRDPLALTRYKSAENDPNVVIRSHLIKVPGQDGDWFREVLSLKVTEEAAKIPNEQLHSSLRWQYISNQDVDEVLILKLFDTAALTGQARHTGEAQGVPHASPDIGDAGYGEPRESIDCRVLVFW